MGIPDAGHVTLAFPNEWQVSGSSEHRCNVNKEDDDMEVGAVQTTNRKLCSHWLWSLV